MAHAPLVYQVHALLAPALFDLSPFGRLVHAFTLPLGYVTRPYVVCRSRGRSTAHPTRTPSAHRSRRQPSVR